MAGTREEGERVQVSACSQWPGHSGPALATSYDDRTVVPLPASPLRFPPLNAATQTKRGETIESRWERMHVQLFSQPPFDELDSSREFVCSFDLFSRPAVVAAGETSQRQKPINPLARPAAAPFTRPASPRRAITV